jgi:tRNA threonylcarbamoyladenosine biosynthesis protein TsaB
VRLLAIETATLNVGAAVFEDDRTLAASSSRPGRLHVETLHPAIERVLAESNTPPGALAAIAVDVGPGLFTGLRVGVAAAKAFAFALSLPVVAVRSTEALREAAARTLGDDHVIVPVVDMRRGEVAWELEVGDVEIGTPETLALRLSAAGPVALVGDGSRRLGDDLVSSVGAHLVEDEELLAPSVEAVGRLGILRLGQGVLEDAISVAPVYLRQADAVINYETRAPGRIGVRR